MGTCRMLRDVARPQGGGGALRSSALAPSSKKGHHGPGSAHVLIAALRRAAPIWRATGVRARGCRRTCRGG